MAGRTVFVATYPPRRCGIATFTRNLADSTGDHEIAVLHAPGDPDVYPSEVRHRIRRDILADYLKVARTLNRSSVGAVSVQHEYGIWGGDDVPHSSTESIRAPTGDPGRPRGSKRGQRGDVAVGRSAADSHLWHRPELARCLATRGPEPPPGRARHDQAQPWPGPRTGDPELWPPRSGQGL